MAKRSSTHERTDIYTRITDSIALQLEQGTRPWTKPWNAEHLAGRITRPLRASGKPYRGINVVMLWMAATMKGYSATIWMTYRQALELGGQVRKGEQGTAVAYADKFKKAETADNGEEVEREIFFMKHYTVFNVEQVDGLPPHFYATAAPQISPLEKREQAEAFFAAFGTDVRHGGNRAFYCVEPDFVQMPPFESFKDAESYYATLGHECIHWTRHPSRLAREFGRKRWGDAGYAQEELVAEMGAAFLAADLGLYLEPREDHAAYIASWLEVLKKDKKAVFIAASHAQKALDFLHAKQGKAEDGEPEDMQEAA
jgi:antirestriction protein ArdC